MMKLALIGEGIAKSQSPDLHRRLGKITRKETQYDLVDALGRDHFSFTETVERLRQDGYRGSNITYPFKEEALKLADHISEGVRRVGSSNTLIFETDGIRAENTDYSGFISAYRQSFSNRPAGEVLLIGAGGVGRAVACALGALNITRLHILERDENRGQALVDSLNNQGIAAQCIAPEKAEAQLPEFDGLVNCTPVGHLNHPGCPIAPSALRAHHWVFDAVYIPSRTELLEAAEACSAATLSGVDLFVFQGIDAFRFFVDSPSVNADLDAHVLAIRNHYFHQLVTSAATGDRT